jgi:glycosyltransferase involved in cell wall biosynthesis
MTDSKISVRNDDRRLNILQVYPYYPPAYERGGALRVVHRLATKLVSRGHNVSVFTTDAHGEKGRIDQENQVDVDGLNVKYFRNLSNQLVNKLNLPLPLAFFTCLNSGISDYDIVHIHGFPHLMAVAAARVARRQEIPYIITPHGAVNQPNEEQPPLLRRLFVKAFRDMILSGAQKVTALTTDETARLREINIPEEKIIKIPNGVEIEGLQTESGTDFRSRHNLEEQTIIGFIGRLHKKKGLDIVLECAERFEDSSDLSFIIIGPDDGYGATLRAKIEERDIDNVSLLGFVTESEKIAALDAIDIFLHPSYREGQPMAILEACATGTPVVISEHCALPEVSNHNAGIITQSEADSVEAAIKRLVNSQELRSTMGKNAHKLVKDEFSWEQVIDKYESLYIDNCPIEST